MSDPIRVGVVDDQALMVTGFRMILDSADGMEVIGTGTNGIEAIDLVNRNSYGNMACLFTRSGAAARRFRYEVDAGNIGINIGVAAPMAYFPFSGWKESFFGTLHGQGRHAVEFFTQTKVVVERWPKQWSRRF